MRGLRAVAWWSVGVIALAGCGSEGDTETLIPQTLTDVDNSGADVSQQCGAAGGLAFSSGTDDNRDGRLDADEVDETTVICNMGVSDSMDGGDDDDMRGDESSTFLTTLTRIDPIAPGDETCPNGGLNIHQGVDENSDGVLDDSEIDITETVCDDDFSIITRSSPLAAGSEQCVNGGTLFEVGLDNGDAEGTPNDGVLQDGEVDSSFFECQDAPFLPETSVDPPEGDPGTATIDLSGGDGDVGDGGDGGSLYFPVVFGEIDQFGIPPTIKLFPTGQVDASFALPDYTPDLGENGLVVSADVTLPRRDNNEPVEPTDFADRNIQRLVSWSGGPAASGGGAEVYTGLRVEEGATLTLDSGSCDWTLFFEGDVEILGTLKTDTCEGRDSIQLFAANIVVGPNGRIDTTADGSFASGSITLRPSALAIVQGELDARGGPDASSGNITVSAGGRVYAPGSVLTTGGSSTGGAGSDGGAITLVSGFGGLFLSGTVNADGGDGPYFAGSGGNIMLGGEIRPGDQFYSLRASGTISAVGGSVTATDTCPEVCPAGDGGSVTLRSWADDLLCTADIRTSGGGNALSAGGNAGTVFFSAMRNFPTSRPTTIGIGGSIAAGGGAGTSGGSGAELRIENCGQGASADELLGFASVDLSGGSSQGDQGGNGGALEVERIDTGDVQPRGMFVHTPVRADGGSGSFGGNAGALDVDVTNARLPPFNSDTGLPSFVLAADFSAVGGAPGGPGGDFLVSAQGNIDLSGAVALGGADFDDDDAGRAGSLRVTSAQGAVTVSSDISASGGSSADNQGASAQCVGIQGASVDFSGSITADGGSGTEGGNGGTVTLGSTGASTTSTGTVSVNGGAGTDGLDGADGQFLLDVPQCGGGRGIEVIGPGPDLL